MVYRKINQRKAIVRECSESRIVLVALIVIFMMTGLFIIYYLAAGIIDGADNITENNIITNEESAYVSPEKTEVEPKKIDLQMIVDNWVKNIDGDKGVLIYDLDRDEMVAEYNSNRSFATASLYKLFVVYEGYRRIERGEWKEDDVAGSTGHTISECLDLAVRESNSNCTETLWQMIGRDKLEKIVADDFGITNTSVEDLVSTPNDIAKMMKRFYDHPDISDEKLIVRMKDSFLNQPITEYNWRQGLPSGFSDAVNVYNKVGWAYNDEEKVWDIYNDAAIIEFPEKDRHFIVVVMTNKVPYQQIRKLGTMIEEEFNKY